MLLFALLGLAGISRRLLRPFWLGLAGDSDPANQLTDRADPRNGYRRLRSPDVGIVIGPLGSQAMSLGSINQSGPSRPGVTRTCRALQVKSEGVPARSLPALQNSNALGEQTHSTQTPPPGT